MDGVMRITITFLSIFLGLGVPVVFAQAESSGRDNVAIVNGERVSLAVFEQALRGQLRAGARDSVTLREGIRQELVIQTVLAQAAEKAGIDQTPEIQMRLASLRQSVLAQAWQQQWLDANPATDDEIQSEYDRIKALAGDKEYQIRQVVVRDETAAKLIMDQVKSGKSMSELAKEYSIEPLGKEDGGLLPWVTPAALSDPLDDAVRVAVVGELYPEPVRTASGFHILEVVADRTFTLPALEELRDQLEQTVAQRKLRAAVQAEVDVATVELN